MHSSSHKPLLCHSLITFKNLYCTIYHIGCRIRCISLYSVFCIYMSCSALLIPSFILFSVLCCFIILHEKINFIYLIFYILCCSALLHSYVSWSVLCSDIVGLSAMVIVLVPHALFTANRIIYSLYNIVRIWGQLQKSNQLLLIMTIEGISKTIETSWGWAGPRSVPA